MSDLRIPIRAVQWTGANLAEVSRLANGLFGVEDGKAHLHVQSLNRRLSVQRGDWVIDGITEPFPCPDSWFHEFFKPANPPAGRTVCDYVNGD